MHFFWSFNSSKEFTVISCYNRFKEKFSGPPLNPIIIKRVDLLWKVRVPPKILFFSWRIIHNKIATKDQLWKRGIVLDGNDANFVFCSLEEKSILHLLGGCPVLVGIWRKVFDRIGPLDNVSLEEFEDFFSFAGKVKNRTKRSIVAVI